MEKYDYRAAMVKDIKDYIINNPDLWADPMNEDDINNYWYDLLWSEDCITGNGTYWYESESVCEEYLSHNIDLALEAVQEFGIDMKALLEAASNHNAARYMDCTIRCYLLGECVDRALEELNETQDK